MLPSGLYEATKHLQKVRVFKPDKITPKSTANKKLICPAQPHVPTLKNPGPMAPRMFQCLTSFYDVFLWLVGLKNSYLSIKWQLKHYPFLGKPKSRFLNRGFFFFFIVSLFLHCALLKRYTYNTITLAGWLRVLWESTKTLWPHITCSTGRCLSMKKHKDNAHHSPIMTD